ncbi:MAG: hypothetical protein ACLP5E_15790 [Streptosporangiaceae bacterium]
MTRLLAAGAWGWMGDQLRLWTTTARTEIRQPRLEVLSSPLVRLLEAADHELRDEIVAALGGYGDNVLGCLMPALRSAVGLPADARRAAGLDVVARDCGQRLGAVIARPLREEDDWSVEWTGCGCDLCDTLGRFSVPGRSGSSSGHWRRTDGGTSTPRSTRPRCRCGTRPGGSGGHTRLCWQRPVSCSPASRARGRRP